MKNGFNFKKYSTLLALFFLALILSMMTKGDFILSRNITNLSLQISINALCAVGMTFVILTGGIDLSIGSIVALSGVVAGICEVKWGLGTLTSIIAALGVGTLCGLMNGLFISYFQIPPFVITLGMMVIAGGGALIASNSSAISPMSDTFKNISKGFIPPSFSAFIIALLFIFFVFHLKTQLTALKNNKTSFVAFMVESILIFMVLLLPSYSFLNDRGIPLPVLILAIITCVSLFILKKLPLGRYIYAVGGNEEAAYLSGINVKKIKLFVYGLMGFVAGLSGVLLTSRLNSAAPTAGSLMELDAIAAVVIGGNSLAGGMGSVMGPLIGATFIGTVNNGMDLLNIDSNYQMVIKGLIIIIAVWSDSKANKK